MRKIEIEVFAFDELDDDAKERARDWWRSGASDDIQFAAENLCGDWKERGVKILKLDERECSIDFSDYALDTAEKIAGDEYLAGEIPEAAAYLTAQEAEDMANALCGDGSEDEPEGWLEAREKAEEAYEEFRLAIAEFIRRQWEREIDWMYSDECVDDAIEANEYEFTSEGKFHA